MLTMVVLAGNVLKPFSLSFPIYISEWYNFIRTSQFYLPEWQEFIRACHPCLTENKLV